MTTLSLTHDEDWKALTAFLPSNYAQLADDHKQLETQYGNAKITTADWLLRFILLHAGPNLPLRQTVALMAEAGGPSLSAMRLHMKMRRASSYLHALVERMVTWTSEAKPEQWAGYTMTLIDATMVCGPGAKGPETRIHTKMRVADVAVLDAIVTSAGETFKHFTFEPGELVLADRAYGTASNVIYAKERGADVLVRYRRRGMRLWYQGERFDDLTALEIIKGDDVIDFPVELEDGDDRIRGRFIAMRLSQEDAERARKRMKRSRKGDVLSDEALEAAGYVIIFTTVPESRMSAKKCLDAYRLRWQIELQFKRWKSLCGFDRLPNYRDDTIVSWLYAKLLIGILLDRMTSIRDELSPPVHLAVIERAKKKPGRKRATPDGAAAVEAHEHSLSIGALGALAALSA